MPRTAEHTREGSHANLLGVHNSRLPHPRTGQTKALRTLAMVLLATTPTTRHFIGSGNLADRAPFPSSRLVGSPAMKLKANSWQSRLDKAVLDIDIKPGARFRNFERALRDPSFSEDLRSAVETIQQKGFGKGHPEVIETLWPTGTTARSDLEALVALRKQVPEFLQDLQKMPQTLPFQQPDSSTAAPTLPDPTSVLSSLVKFATDPEAQKEFTEEAKNSLRSTPKGLETPKYKVVRTLDGPIVLGKPEVIELRDYPEFTVAKTEMGSFAFGSSSGGEGFNTLASYLFGKNEDNKAMQMTVPVEISSAGNGAGSMAFVLPKSESELPPTPLPGSDVTIEAVPARMVAVKSFGGIVTDQEVERQKVMLLEALAKDSSVVPVDETQISVLQYNSPLTIPWRRRNEVAIVVTQSNPAPPKSAEQSADNVVTSSDSTEQATASIANPPKSTEQTEESIATPSKSIDKETENIATPSTSMEPATASIANLPKSTDQIEESIDTPSKSVDKETETIASPSTSMKPATESIASTSNDTEQAN